MFAKLSKRCPHCSSEITIESKEDFKRELEEKERKVIEKIYANCMVCNTEIVILYDIRDKPNTNNQEEPTTTED